MFRAFIILTHPSVLQELDFIFCTRGRGSWYFRLTGGLANFTPIAGMGHLISKPKFKASSTRIGKFVKTQIFFYEYGLRPHVSSVFSGRIRKFLKTLSRLEIFFIRYAYVYVWTVVSGNFRIRFRHSLGSSLHGEHYKQTWRTARL